jgi:hypothetical protein
MKGQGMNRAIVALAALALTLVAVPVAGAAPQNAVETVKSKRFSATEQATASKKKKKKGKVKTGTGSTSFTTPAALGNPPAIATVPANCPSKTHATGGGWAVSPPLTPPSSGPRTLEVGSAPVGGNAWNTTVAGQASPANVAGTLTAYVRCESSGFGRITELVQGGPSPVAPGGVLNMVFHCAPGNHVVGGGFLVDAPSTANPATGFRILLLGSRRTAVDQWTVTGFNNSGSAQPANMSGWALCEQNGKGRAVSEVSTTAAIAANTRVNGDPTCAGKKHAVSGGFSLSQGASSVPLVGVDEHLPTGKKTWHTGIWAPPAPFLPPEGSTLTSSVYCKKDASKKKKK